MTENSILSPCLAATIGTAECDAVVAKKQKKSLDGAAVAARASCYIRGGL